VAILRFQGIRGIIAQKMRESLEKTAQLSFFCDMDASALVAARAAWRAAGVKIGYEDLIVRALADLLVEFPQFNAVETSEGVEEIADFNIGCAIALPGALVAPAIFDAGKLSVEEIAKKREDLVARARINKLSIQELTSATISISNLGLTRVRHFTPIVNYPQMAIIGLGQIAPRPWVGADGETLTVRPVMGLSLTVDHRAIDGAPAGDFLTALAKKLESGLALPAAR
jgi:pyruvate dehydrogenase E2 component (dihydrolipoamide acetyltransferase)